MNSKKPHRPIKGAESYKSTENDDDLEITKAKLLSFSSCPEEFKLFIEEISLEKLVYWKLFHLFEKFDEDLPNDVLKIILDHVEKPLFVLVLKKTKGNQSKAAEVIGCNRNTLHRKLKKFSIAPSDLRKALKSSVNPDRAPSFNSILEKISREVRQ